MDVRFGRSELVNLAMDHGIHGNLLQTELGVVVGRVVSAAGGHPGVAASHPALARARKDGER